MIVEPKLRTGLLFLAMMGIGAKATPCQQPLNRKTQVHHLSAAQGQDGGYYMVDNGTLLHGSILRLGKVKILAASGADSRFILDSGTYSLGKKVAHLNFELVGAKGQENILDLTEAAKEYDPAFEISSAKNNLNLGAITFDLRNITWVKIGQTLIAVPSGQMFGPEFGLTVERAFQTTHGIQAMPKPSDANLPAP